MIYKQRTYLTARWTWYLIHPWEVFGELYKEVKAFIQRGLRGYADCDVWSFDSYLRDILIEGLKVLSSGMSYPIGNTAKKWRKDLRLNAKRFQDVTDYEMVGWENDKNFKKRKKVYKEQDKALKFVAKWFNNLWD